MYTPPRLHHLTHNKLLKDSYRYEIIAFWLRCETVRSYISQIIKKYRDFNGYIHTLLQNYRTFKNTKI